MFDVVFSGIVLFFCYNLYEAYANGREIIVDIKYNQSLFLFDNSFVGVYPVQKQYVYSISDIRNLKEKAHNKDVFSYKVEIIPSIHLSCSSPTRSCTPDYKGRLRKQSEEMFPFSPSLSVSSPLCIEEQKAYYFMLKEFSYDNQVINLDLIPKDPQIGKIIWMNDDYGKIQTIDPVLRMNVFCFEKKDCVADDDDFSLSMGDRVMFTIMVSEKKLYATNVRLVAKRTISSPDLSRLVMRQPNLPMPLDDFEL